jgi:membrane-associated phospholipid phosphatase
MAILSSTLKAELLILTREDGEAAAIGHNENIWAPGDERRTGSSGSSSASQRGRASQGRCKPNLRISSPLNANQKLQCRSGSSMLSAFVFYSFLFLLLVVMPVALIFVVLLFLEHERRLWQREAPAAKHLRARLEGIPLLANIVKRFPRAWALLTHRFRTDDPWGLTATLAICASAFGGWIFLGVMRHVLGKDPLVTLDIRLHNAVLLFRTTNMTSFMLVLTDLGSATVLSLLCIGIALLALERNWPRLAATFVLALGSSSLLSRMIKGLLDFPRPSDSLLRESSASFPSEYLLSATVIYGLLAALVLGSRASRSVQALGATALLLVVVGIGLSRLYLGAHWPSDLLGSLTLALMLLPLLLFFLHYSKRLHWIDSFHLSWRHDVARRVGAGMIVLALTAAVVLANHRELVPMGPPPASHAINLAVLSTSFPANLPRQSEDLIGGKMEPVSLVLIGSRQDLWTDFYRAGWARADAPTPVRVVQEGLATLQNLPDANGPATPAFFADQPQDVTFEKADALAPTIRHRHHTRLWQTHYCLAPVCRPVWVATASYDVGVEFSPRSHLPTHRIDPAIDHEREFIVADLIRTGATYVSRITVLPPLHGTNAAGDTFFSDGRATVIALP